LHLGPDIRYKDVTYNACNLVAALKPESGQQLSMMASAPAFGSASLRGSAARDTSTLLLLIRP
jgi:hypothetical protein